MSPQPPDPSVQQTALDVVEFWAKVAGIAVAVWQFIERAWKPYQRWRREQLAKVIRDILKDDLDCVRSIKQGQDEQRQGEERVAEAINEVLRRQEHIFNDMDDFLAIAKELIEREEETRDLLDAAGFSSRDRRSIERVRPKVHETLAELTKRQRERRRQSGSFLADAPE